MATESKNLAQSLVSIGIIIGKSGSTPKGIRDWAEKNGFYNSESEVETGKPKIKYSINQLIAMFLTKDKTQRKFITGELNKKNPTRFSDVKKALSGILDSTSLNTNIKLGFLWIAYHKIARVTIVELNSINLNYTAFFFEHLLQQKTEYNNIADLQNYLTNFSIAKVKTGIDYNGEKLFLFQTPPAPRLSQMLKIDSADLNSWLIGLKLKNIYNEAIKEINNSWQDSTDTNKSIVKMMNSLRQSRYIKKLDEPDSIDEMVRIIHSHSCFNSLSKLKIITIVKEVQKVSKLFNEIKTKTDIPAKTRILILGDSVAAGLFAKENWVTKVSEQFKKDGYNFEFVNSSVIGDTTRSGIRVIEDEMLLYKPDIAMVTLGGNDALEDQTMLQTSGNIEFIIKNIYRNSAKPVHVVHGFGVPEPIMERSENAKLIHKTMGHHIEKLNNRFKTEVEQGLGVFEMLPAETFKKENCTEEGSIDDVHPRDVKDLIKSAVKHLAPILQKLQPEVDMVEEKPAAAAPKP